jgi:hypothetical protein
MAAFTTIRWNCVIAAFRRSARRVTVRKKARQKKKKARQKKNVRQRKRTYRLG